MILSSATAAHAHPAVATPSSRPGAVDACRRRWPLLLLPALVSAAGAHIALSAATPQYVAEALVALESRKIQVVNIDSVVSGLSQENAALRTELDIIGSYGMAAHVADRLLAESPEEARALGQRERPDLAGRLLRSGRELAARFGLSPSIAESSPVEPEPVSRDDIIDGLRSGLRVSTDNRSLTILISFRWRNPDVAARMANMFAEVYLENQVGVKREATRKAAEWLAGRLVELRAELEASEQALFSYRWAAGLFETRGATSKAQQLSEMNSQLVVARARRIGAEGRLQAARHLRQNGDIVDSLSDVLQSVTIQRLRADETDVRRRLAELRDAGGLRDPRFATLEANAAALSRQMVAEADRIIASIANEVDIARQMERDLEAAVRGMEAEYGDMSRGLVRLNQLQREADANRLIYESFLQRYKQTIEQRDLAEADARLISQAVPPRNHSGPHPVPVVALAALAGLGLGVGAALLADRRDGRPRTIAELEEATGLPVLGLMRRSGRGARSPAGRWWSRSDADALDRVFTTLTLARRDRRTRSVLVTSSMPGEGAAAFCTALARRLAKAGLRVLVIDTDGTRSGIGCAYGVQPVVGLGEVLSETAPPAETAGADPGTGVHLVATTPGPGHRPKLLSQTRLATVMEEAARTHDLVLVAAPPILSSADSVVVAGAVDARLLYVRWGHTTLPTLRDALRIAALCGVVFDGIVAGGTRFGREQDTAGGQPSLDEPRLDTLPARA